MTYWELILLTFPYCSNQECFQTSLQDSHHCWSLHFLRKTKLHCLRIKIYCTKTHDHDNDKHLRRSSIWRLRSWLIWAGSVPVNAFSAETKIKWKTLESIIVFQGHFLYLVIYNVLTKAQRNYINPGIDVIGDLSTEFIFVFHKKK